MILEEIGERVGEYAPANSLASSFAVPLKGITPRVLCLPACLNASVNAALDRIEQERQTRRNSSGMRSRSPTSRPRRCCRRCCSHPRSTTRFPSSYRRICRTTVRRCYSIRPRGGQSASTGCIAAAPQKSCDGRLPLRCSGIRIRTAGAPPEAQTEGASCYTEVPKSAVAAAGPVISRLEGVDHIADAVMSKTIAASAAVTCQSPRAISRSSYSGPQPA